MVTGDKYLSWRLCHDELEEIVDRVGPRIGLPNKVSSNVKVVEQGFDNRTQEHVVWLEYRCRVRSVPRPRPNPQLVKTYNDRQMAMLKALLALNASR